MEVFRAEQLHYLRDSALYSSTDQARLEANGVAKWLEKWLNGTLEEHYTHEARAELGLPEPGQIGGNSRDRPPGGSEFMESDGLTGD